jgi:hypothetical protein
VVAKEKLIQPSKPESRKENIITTALERREGRGERREGEREKGGRGRALIERKRVKKKVLAQRESVCEGVVSEVVGRASTSDRHPLALRVRAVGRFRGRQSQITLPVSSASYPTLFVGVLNYLTRSPWAKSEQGFPFSVFRPNRFNFYPGSGDEGEEGFVEANAGDEVDFERERAQGGETAEVKPSDTL